jgi:ribonuclease III
VFRAVVEVGGRPLGAGEGRSKKAAEQLAAEAAWRAISAEAKSKDDPERIDPPPDFPGPDSGR